MGVVLAFAAQMHCQGEYLWTRTITRSNDHAVKDIIVDDKGNTYITGIADGRILDHNYQTYYNIYSEYIFLIKLNSNGHICWARTLTGEYQRISDNILLDDDSNIYITGAFKNKLEVDSVVIDTALYSDIQQLFVMKFDTHGNLIWSYSPDSDDWAIAYDIECDEEQNCYITGSFNGDLTIGDTTLTQAYLAYADESALLFKLDSNANVVWAQNWKGFNKYSAILSDTLHTGLEQICKAENDNFFVSGTFNKLLIIDNYDSIEAGGGSGGNNNGSQDAIVGKIDSDGNIIWLRNFGINTVTSASGRVGTTHIIADVNGILYVAGYFYSPSHYPMVIDSFSLENSWAYDLYYVKFLQDGGCAWLRSNKGLNNSDYPHDFIFDRDKKLIMSAEMSQTNYFINDTVSLLQCSNPGMLEINPTNGYLNHAEYPYPFSTIHPYPYNGYFPQIYIDNLGNQYKYAIGHNYYDESNPYASFEGIHLTKMTSGDVHLSGITYHDQNQNAIFDSTESTISNNIIIMDTGAYFRSTDEYGKFEIREDISEHIVEAVTPLYWEATTPIDPNWYFLDTLSIDDSLSNLNFGFSMYPDIIDIRINLTTSRCVPGFPAVINLDIENIGTEFILAGTAQLSLDEKLLFESSSDSSFILNGSNITWNFDSLDVGDQHKILAFVQVPPDVTLIGDTLRHFAMVTPITNDTNQINNYDTITPIIYGAFDPNYKENYPTGHYDKHYVRNNDSIFEYTVHFQNVGLSEAINIKIIDSIDQNFDILTIDMLGASHNYNYEIYGSGVVCWSFDSIMLPDSGSNLLGSNGYVKYKIQTRKNLTIGTEFSNKAHIYFDFNPPIITNNCINTIYDCDTINLEISDFNCWEDNVVGNTEVDYISNAQWLYSTNIISDNENLVWHPDTSGVYNINLSIYNDICIKDTTIEVTVLPKPEVLLFTEFLLPGDSLLIYGLYQHEAGIYYDTIINQNNCDSVVSTIIEIDYSSLREQNINMLEVFPVPTRGKLSINLSEPNTHKIQLNLYDSRSNLIFKRTLGGSTNSFEIDLSEYKKGEYYLTLIIDQQQITRKIVVN